MYFVGRGMHLAATKEAPLWNPSGAPRAIFREARTRTDEPRNIPSLRLALRKNLPGLRLVLKLRAPDQARSMFQPASFFSARIFSTSSNISGIGRSPSITLISATLENLLMIFW